MKWIHCHWTLHPDKRVGLYHDENGKPRSPWYDHEIKSKSMTQSAVARELDMSDELSVEGIVFPEFREDRHVYRGKPVIRPDLPVIRVFDYGACCAALFMQKDAYGRINVFKELVIETDGSAPKLAKMAAAYSADLDCDGFQDYDDPAGSHDGWVSGTTSVQIMNQHNIFPTHKVSGASARRRTDRVQMIHAKLLERTGDGDEVIQIHEGCQTLIDAFQSGYRYLEKSDGSIDLDVIDERHPSEDVMDCFGMGLMEVLTVAEPVKPRRQQAPRRKRNPKTGY